MLKNWRYWLSWVVPVRFTSTYGVDDDDGIGGGGWREHATWWQWRPRFYRHEIRRLA